MLMPEVVRDGIGAGTGGLTGGLVGGMTGQPGTRAAFAWRIAHPTAYRSIARRIDRSIARAVVQVGVRRLGYASIVGGFTAAPALCLIGVGCLALPVAPALQASAGAFITVGALWTVFALVASNLWLGATHG